MLLNSPSLYLYPLPMCLPICMVICSSMCLSYFTYPSMSVYPSIYLPIYPYLYVYLSLFPVFYLELIELLQRALQILFLYSLLAHTKNKLISLKSSGPSLALGGYLTSFPQDIGGLSMRHFSERTCRRFVNLQFPWTTIKNLKI